MNTAALRIDAGSFDFALSHARSGAGQLVSEAVATFGLVVTIVAVERHRPAATPFAVALFIVSAYWFTASTSFANPAVTLARAATDTFAGIRPADVPGFVVAQLLGGAGALGLAGWLWAPAARPGEASRATGLEVEAAAPEA